MNRFSLGDMSRRERRLQRKSIVKKKYVSPSSHEAKVHDVEQSTTVSQRNKRGLVRKIYEDDYRKLMFIPILMLIASLVIIGIQFNNTGNFMNFGVSITGGISVTVPSVEDFVPLDVEQKLLLQMEGADVSVRRLVSPESIGVTVEASGVDNELLLSSLRGIFGEFQDYSLEETGSTLGEAFFRQSLFALLFAFVLMGTVVFLSFKSFVPSLAVVLSAFFDIIVTIAIVNLLGIRVSAAGLAAFLMLIGYSVDTDVLMASKMMHGKKSSILKNLYDAMGTGMMMALTTIVALIVGITFSNSEVLSQIMTIVLIGLIVDLVSTWIQNAGMMRMYLERKMTE